MLLCTSAFVKTIFTVTFHWYWVLFFNVKCFMEQTLPTVSCERSWVSDSSLILFQNMSILYSWYWDIFVWLLWVRLYDVIIMLIEEYLMVCFYDLAAMISTCINSMIESVVWNDSSCVVSWVLLMCGIITSVIMTYIHAVLQRFALLFSMVDEAYRDTIAG